MHVCVCVCVYVCMCVCNKKARRTDSHIPNSRVLILVGAIPRRSSEHTTEQVYLCVYLCVPAGVPTCA